MKLFEHETAGPFVQNMVSLKPELEGMRVVALSTDVHGQTIKTSLLFFNFVGSLFLKEIKRLQHASWLIRCCFKVVYLLGCRIIQSS